MRLKPSKLGAAVSLRMSAVIITSDFLLLDVASEKAPLDFAFGGVGEAAPGAAQIEGDLALGLAEAGLVQRTQEADEEAGPRGGGGAAGGDGLGGRERV